jgi:hypothetical protein
VHITRSDFKAVRKCWISSVMDGSDDDILWKGSEVGGNVRSECDEDEGTDCEMERVIPTGKGRQNLTPFVY